jgi:ABC-type multidrug transport system fused ATPase/permease subunit
MLIKIIKKGWFPTLITAVAVLGLIFYDKIDYTVTVPVLIVMLCIGGVMAVINARQARLERQCLRLSQLGAHFSRRFMGNSTISIFAIIDTLFGLENQQVWEWARGAEMTRRVFDSWAEHFAARVEADLRNRRYTAFLQTHVNELWAINNHYYEFIEQFTEIAQRFEVPRETVEQYRKFTEEYNLFVGNFRDAINELKTIARTQLEAPSVKTARELGAA